MHDALRVVCVGCGEWVVTRGAACYCISACRVCGVVRDA